MPDVAYLSERIAQTKKQITAWEAAELAIANGSIQSYTLDTGQNRATVVKVNATELRRMIDQLYNRLATLEARLFGSATTVAPLW